MSKETFAGEPLDPYALKDEIKRLRSDLAAVTAERDRLREALRPIVPSKVLDEEESTLVSNRLLNDAFDAYLARSRHDDDETPRAAIEGVKEPKQSGAEDE